MPLYLYGTQMIHAWINYVVRIILSAQTENFDVAYQLHIIDIVYENNGTHCFLEQTHSQDNALSFDTKFCHQVPSPCEVQKLQFRI